MSTSTSTSTTPINNIKNLAYNILKTFKDSIVKGIKITELEHCLVCRDEIITHPLKAFTTLSCRHVFHRICIEKELLLTMPNTCSFSGCSKEVEIIETNARRGSESSTSLVVRRMEKHSIQSQDMPEILEEDMSDIDMSQEDPSSPTLSKKRVSEPIFSDKSSNKKVKKLVKKESNILEDLIKELSTEPKTQVSVIRKENAISFNDLYNNITNSEMQNEIMNQDVITNYYLFGKALSERLEHYKKSNPPYASLLLVNEE
ncbi:18194_t:CDS:1, partial [Cetraspora pellucida]